MSQARRTIAFVALVTGLFTWAGVDYQHAITRQHTARCAAGHLGETRCQP